MTNPAKGLGTLSELRTLLQSLADQLEDEDADRTSMSRAAHGRMVPDYVVAQSASASDQESAAEIITQVQGARLSSVRTVVEIVDGLADELASGVEVDFKKIQFPGLESLLAER